MKPLVILGILLGIFSGCMSKEEPKSKADPNDELDYFMQNFIVKDSSGRVIPMDSLRWYKKQGYKFWPANGNDPTDGFILVHMSDSELLALQNEEIPSKEYFLAGSNYPYFSGVDLNGEKVSSERFKNKILVVNYWFTQCMPCRNEIPALNELQKEFSDRVDFVALTFDDNNKVKRFLKKNAFTYQLISAPEHVEAQGVNYFPTNLLVDRNGKIIFQSIGYESNTVSALRENLLALLNLK